LFIDGKPGNVAGAGALGMTGHVHTGSAYHRADRWLAAG